MAGNEEHLAAIASAILDGTAVDWDTAASRVEDAERPLIDHLKVVAALAGVHRLPATWGHLQLIERIGKGTFGEVYRAWDPRLDREVALKLLPAPDAAGAPDSFAIREGRLLARVRHNNVVTIHGAERVHDHIGLWMELVRGRTLEQKLRQDTLFSAGEARRIGCDLCSAVSAVHDAGLLHRDIKAHNVMVADDNRVVLMDFGTGLEIQDGLTSDLAGTPLYVAPEVLDGKPATVESDIYSLGVLLFHVLSGNTRWKAPPSPTFGRLTTLVHASASAPLGLTCLRESRVSSSARSILGPTAVSRVRLHSAPRYAMRRLDPHGDS